VSELPSQALEANDDLADIRSLQSWEIVSLGDYIQSIESGKSFKCDERPPVESEIGVIKISAVTWGEYLEEESKTCHNPSLVNEKFFINNGDFLFSRANTIELVGACVIASKVTKRIMLSDKILRINFKGLNPGYVLYFLRSRQGRVQIEAFSTGNQESMRNIGQQRIKSIQIPIPPFQEQHRIVAKIETLFSELDKGIESLKIAREQLKVYRQAVLKHAFEGKLTAQWREQNNDKLETPEQLLARISAPKQPRGGREASGEIIEGIAALSVNNPTKKAPDGWLWTPLLRIARQETGHTPSRKHPEYWGGDQYWIGIVDARQHHGQVIQDTLQKATKLGLENSSARILCTDTVCLSRTASVGYVTIMGKPMATSQDFATWSCTEALDPKFLMYALMAEGNEIRRFGKGTTHTTIYFPEIRALHICLPSVQEQKVIVETVESKLQHVGKMVQETEDQLKRSETLRQSILKKAFSGQLVPQDPNDEPASALLARIQSEIAVQPKLSKSRKKTIRRGPSEAI
jgi:type I restriction enzyme S subunit